VVELLTLLSGRWWQAAAVPATTGAAMREEGEK